MEKLARLKKLIPSDHGYSDPDLEALLSEQGLYRAAAEVLRSMVAQIVAGTFRFTSGAQGGGVTVDKSRLVDNYKTLITEYEEKADAATPPHDDSINWKADIDPITAEDFTRYAD